MTFDNACCAYNHDALTQYLSVDAAKPITNVNS